MWLLYLINEYYLSYAILQWLKCKENLLARIFFLKMSKRSLLFLGTILLIVGELYVECSLFMVRKDLSLTENYLYTSFVPIVSKIECAKFCSVDASCETATYNVTSRTCSLSSTASVHDSLRWLFTSDSGMYVMSRFRYPGKTELEQLFTSAAASGVVVVSFVVPCDDINKNWDVDVIS